MSYLNFSDLIFHIFHKTRGQNLSSFLLKKKMPFSVSLDSSPKTNIVKFFLCCFLNISFLLKMLQLIFKSKYSKKTVISILSILRISFRIHVLGPLFILISQLRWHLEARCISILLRGELIKSFSRQPPSQTSSEALIQVFELFHRSKTCEYHVASKLCYSLVHSLYII